VRGQTRPSFAFSPARQVDGLASELRRLLRPRHDRGRASRLDWDGAFPIAAIGSIASGGPDAAAVQGAKPLRLGEVDRNGNESAAPADGAQLVLDVEGGHDSLKDGKRGLAGSEGQVRHAMRETV
jgi:hypothetical protein